MKKNLLGLALSFLIMVGVASSLLAQTLGQSQTGRAGDTTWVVSPKVPRVLDYQGVLTNPDGEP